MERRRPLSPSTADILSAVQYVRFAPEASFVIFGFERILPHDVIKNELSRTRDHAVGAILEHEHDEVQISSRSCEFIEAGVAADREHAPVRVDHRHCDRRRETRPTLVVEIVPD